MKLFFNLLATIGLVIGQFIASINTAILPCKRVQLPRNLLTCQLG